MSDGKPKGLAKCRVPGMAQFADGVRAEVRRCMTQLQTDGWAAVEIAEYIGTSRRTLYRWRNGDELPNVAEYFSLKELAAEFSGKRRLG